MHACLNLVLVFKTFERINEEAKFAQKIIL